MPLLPTSLSKAFRATPPDVCFVPGHLFFTRCFDLPEGIGVDDVASFVELNLESVSPFPLEQLYYGFVVSDQRESVLVYAAYRRRFSAETIKTWESADSVLPAFLPALKNPLTAEGMVYLREPEVLTALHFRTGCSLPVSMISRPLASDADHDTEAEAERILRNALSVANDVPVLRMRTEGVFREERGAYQFECRADGEDGAVNSLKVSAGTLWSLDIRDTGFLNDRRRSLRIDNGLWRTLQACGICLLLLIIGEFGLLVGQKGYLGWLRHKTEARKSEVSALDNKLTIIHQLENFGRSNLIPFQMLSSINKYRPSSVYFTRAATQGRTSLIVEASTRNVADANRYAAALRKVPEIEKVDIRNLKPQQSGTTFTLVVDFKQNAFGENSSPLNTQTLTEADGQAGAGKDKS